MCVPFPPFVLPWLGHTGHTDRAQSQVEDGIAAKEIAYLESTPGGNIITGFDNYMKGQSGAAAQRRKVGPLENNRVFSKSSISYRPNTVRFLPSPWYYFVMEERYADSICAIGWYTRLDTGLACSHARVGVVQGGEQRDGYADWWWEQEEEERGRG